MKFIILFILMFSLKAIAAVNAGMVWEFRSTGTASMANSGGYDSTVASPGTDYTLQDGSQFSGSNLATANGTTNPCAVTSATHNFVSTDNGNTIRIASGGTFTAGIYEIISTAGNAATLDRACAATASTSNGVWTEGGALNYGSATLDSSFWAATQPGNVVWFKNGTYTTGGAVAAGTAGTTVKPIMVKGYSTTRGDAPLGSTRPTVNSGANNYTYANNVDVYNMIHTGTAASTLAIGASAKVINTKVINTSTTAARNALNIPSGATNAFIMGVEAVSYRGRAVNSASSANQNIIIGCYIHDSDIGYMDTATGLTSLVNNIISDNVTAAVQFTGIKTGSTVLQGNTLYGSENKLGIGLSIATGGTNYRAINNIIYGFATGVSHADVQTISYDEYNDYFNNTADVTNWTKGSTTIAVNPAFGNVAQLTGATATTSGNVLTQSGADFSTVTNNVDFAYLVSGTGITAGKYLITSHTTTTITLDIAPGSSAVADKVWQVTTGHNFAVSYVLKSLGFPGTFPGALTNGYLDIGAVQRREGSPGIGVRR